MSIREEIFETFIAKLQQREDIPQSVITKLKNLKDDEKLWSKETILKVIKEGD